MHVYRKSGFEWYLDPRSGETVFDGRKDHSLDAKGRVSVPERFRQVLSVKSARELVLTQSPVTTRICLMAWPPDEWTAFLTSLTSVPSSHPVRQYLDDIVLSTKECCPIDGNGRILIPQHLRVFSNLTNQARFIGRGTKFEIWCPEHHEDLLVKHRSNVEINKELHLFGV